MAVWSLPLACGIAAVVAIAIVERILNASVSAVWYVTVGFGEGEAKFDFAGLQLLSVASSSCTKLVSIALNLIASAIAGAATWIALALALVLTTGMLFMAYEQYPLVARSLTLQWNNGIGPRMHGLVVMPLNLVNLFLGAFLPLYNTFTWVFSRIIAEGFVAPVVNSPDEMMRALTSTALMTRTSAESISSYAIATVRSCGAQTGNNSVTDAQCLGDVGTRTLDLITPLTHLRDVVAIAIGWFSIKVCGYLAAPLDILFAPFMDINFAKAAHNLVNAVLWTFVQLPVVTEARCRLYSAREGVVMCLPDFEPTFRFLMEGLRRLGQGVDNWVDVAFLVIQVVHMHRYAILSPFPPRASSFPLLPPL